MRVRYGGSHIGEPEQNLERSSRETVVLNGKKVIAKVIDAGLLTREWMRRLHHDGWDSAKGHAARNRPVPVRRPLESNRHPIRIRTRLTRVIDLLVAHQFRRNSLKRKKSDDVAARVTLW